MLYIIATKSESEQAHDNINNYSKQTNMKTYKNLLEIAISDRVMLNALDKASKGKMGRKDVQYIHNHLTEVREHVRQMILSKNYPHITHNAHIIKQANNGKERVIVPPHFSAEIPEQWLHHILIQTIGGILLKGAYFHSHASIPGKGVFSAKKYIERYIQRHPKKCRWYLKLDIKKFYHNVDTKLLKEKIAKKIKDEHILALANWIIDSNDITMPNGAVEKRGLLIGFYTSQFFANYFLQDLDHYIKEELKAPFYARYMDDMVIFHSNKRELLKIRDAIVEKIHSEHLELKKNPEIQSFKASPCAIIGFKFYKNRTTLKPNLIKRASQVARKIHKEIATTGKMSPNSAKSMISYIGWFKRTNTYMFYANHIAPLVNMAACKVLVSRTAREANRLKEAQYKAYTCTNIIPAQYR